MNVMNPYFSAFLRIFTFFFNFMFYFILVSYLNIWLNLFVGVRTAGIFSFQIVTLLTVTSSSPLTLTSGPFQNLTGSTSKIPHRVRHEEQNKTPENGGTAQRSVCKHNRMLLTNTLIHINVSNFRCECKWACAQSVWNKNASFPLRLLNTPCALSRGFRAADLARWENFEPKVNSECRSLIVQQP